MATISRKWVPGIGHLTPVKRGGLLIAASGSCEEFRGNCQPLPDIWTTLGGQQTSRKHTHTHPRTQPHLPSPPGASHFTNGLLQRLVGDLLAGTRWGRRDRSAQNAQEGGGGGGGGSLGSQLPGSPFTSQKTVPMGRTPQDTWHSYFRGLEALCLWAGTDPPTEGEQWMMEASSSRATSLTWKNSPSSPPLPPPRVSTWSSGKKTLWFKQVFRKTSQKLFETREKAVTNIISYENFKTD